MAVQVPEPLLVGYRRFRHERFPGEVEHYRRLAQGQSPHTLVVGCADSRADPATIFAAEPGELFVVRNVANLVPPPDSSSGYHGTSAALEFAVTGLKVGAIVVMGHGQCGGIAAALAEGAQAPVGTYIAPWVAQLADVRARILADQTVSAVARRQHAFELAGIRYSLANLRRFPFVRAALESRRLGLHGAWFSIAEGTLHWLDQETDSFAAIE